MHRPSLRPALLLSLLLPTALLLGACDRGDELESPEPLVGREAQAADAPEAGAPREGAHHRGPGKKVDRLCEKLECTADQRTHVEGIAVRMRSERPEPSGDRDAANRTLAQAFTGERFSAADLGAYRKAVEPDADDRDALIVEAAVELHGILDAEQREILATKVAEHGLPFMGGKRGGKHRDHAADGERGSDERGAKKAARLCEMIGCSEAQSAKIAALVQARPERSEVPAADREALAQAIRSEALSEAAVSAYLDAARVVRAAEHEAQAARVVELHGVLTAEQRATLAERFAAEGPRALGLHGGEGRHGKKGGHGKKGRRGDGPRGEQGEARGVG